MTINLKEKESINRLKKVACPLAEDGESKSSS
jgi:hypothetical protein